MSKIKVSELFFSLQGEARYTGVPSVFLRTFGCNFTCSGFGMPPGELSTEAIAIAERAGEFRIFNDLPLVTTGCDSYSSWMPEFKHLSPMLEVGAISDRIAELLPHKAWRDEHLVITGGEPLLGWQRAFPELLDQPGMQALKEITFETNGTQPLTKEFNQYLLNWTLNPRGGVAFGGAGPRGKQALTFSVSAKLSCSGESRADAIKPEVVLQYQELGHTYLKLVVATEQDVEEALTVVDIYRKAGFTGVVYLMPVGGTAEVYHLNNTRVANLAMQHGLRYSDRLHLPLFGNAWAT